MIPDSGALHLVFDVNEVWIPELFEQFRVILVVFLRLKRQLSLSVLLAAGEIFHVKCWRPEIDPSGTRKYSLVSLNVARHGNSIISLPVDIVSRKPPAAEAKFLMPLRCTLPCIVLLSSPLCNLELEQAANAGNSWLILCLFLQLVEDLKRLLIEGIILRATNTIREHL